MDAVILNYRAGKGCNSSPALCAAVLPLKRVNTRSFFRAGNGGREDSVNVFRGNGRGWDLIMLFIIRYIVMARRENEDLSILIRPTDRRACNE